MSDSNNNIISINNNKKNINLLSGQEDQFKKFKPSLASIEEKLIRYLEDGEIPPYMDTSIAPYDWNIWFFSDDPLRPARILKVDPVTRTAMEIGKEALCGEINEAFRRFCRMDNHPSGRYCLSSREIQGFANKLIYSGRRLPAWPKPIGFKSETDLAFQRFDFDPAEKASLEDFPTIATNLRHMSNSRNFCERVGSLYDDEANRKQVLFLIGDGDGGKSSLIDLLTYLAGGTNGVASIGMSVYDSFGFDPLLDKRVWIAEELSPQFFKNGKFKTLTGGTAVQINRKGEKQFNAYLQGMLVATSNKTPKIDNDSGLRNRILICEVDPIPKEDRLPLKETHRRMRQELPHFIRYCLDAYSKVTGDGTLVPDTTERLDSIIEDEEITCEAIFDEYFEEDLTALGNDAKVRSKDFNKVWEKICDEHKQFARERNCKTNFENYIKRRLGLKNLSIRVKQVRYIPGIKILR